MLKHELLPWQREEITEAMRDVLLPSIRREGRTVHHVVTDVNVLDCHVSEGYAKRQGASPPVRGEICQSNCVQDHHSALSAENQSKNIPHVHHLLGCDSSEEEG